MFTCQGIRGNFFYTFVRRVTKNALSHPTMVYIYMHVLGKKTGLKTCGLRSYRFPETLCSCNEKCAKPPYYGVYIYACVGEKNWLENLWFT